jgi:transposase
MVDASLDDSHQDSHQAGTYRRIELITGEARRRRWTTEEKAKILAESFQPGANVSEVARRYGVNRGLLWTWRHHARKRGGGGEQTFVPIRILEESTALPTSTAAGQREGATSAPAARPEDTRAGPATGSIEIEIGGARVRVSGAVDAAALQQVLTHLGRRS